MMLDIDLHNARTYLEQLNLDYIVKSMCSDSYPLPRWTLSDAERCCHLYKNFLLLQKIHHTETLVPTREIDEFWHNHILYTKQYVYDCMNIYGQYLHHAPADPDEDVQSMLDQYQKTKAYYLQEFSTPLVLIK